MPTEVVELPSRGLIYPESNPLSSGKVEMKYMTAKEEDILTNQSYIKNGTVLDKLLQSLIVSKIDYNDLIVGDKNAILIASRVLGYGSDYKITYGDKSYTIDLSKVENKPFDETSITKGKNEFNFQLPFSKVTITFKLLTHGDEQKIEKEIKGLEKVNAQGSYDITTRLKHTIIAVNGDTDVANVREFCENMLARDVKALREHVNKIMPDINLKVNAVKANGDVVEGVDLPIGINFFWPDA